MSKNTHEIKDCMPATIEYEFFEGYSETLTDEDYQHIKGLIKDGYIQGELIHEDHSQNLETSGQTRRGWWKII